MYTTRQQPYTPYGLGIAPAVVYGAVQTGSGVIDWLTGHSTMYEAMQAAIPKLRDLALAGDARAYVVLRAWSGEENWCPLASRQAGAYLINMRPGDTGPCGAAPALKPAAKAAWQRVDSQAPAVAAAANLAFTTGGTLPGTPPAASPVPAPSTGTRITVPTAVAGIPIVPLVLGVAALGVVLAMTPKRGQR